ncbi:hypothetical protein AKJ56_00095 [candidate division MSBL1 archaeon SCGC-AAA382N08]|uniref:Carbohydrate kinase PfkB domain-containing protein n=1 Tax=candidate division MSBL1 archaeon SCGC-AAA382N08 TaxID=1698285 RepID=A0A133VQW8_9EURY|nr:hypothetical protein AKJ56_00095 [candidate division MSBL1 archaeon SCGC-AAA382N08]
MYDVVTFGSATWDFFLDLEDFRVIENEDFVTGEGLCFNLGSKVEIEDISFFSGGGGTNVAATFSNQGLEVAYCGGVGKDFAGKEIVEILEERGIVTDYVQQFEEKVTNRSVILTSEGQERTILAYRGASELLTEDNIPWEALEAKWFYLAPLSGKLGRITEQIVDYAAQNNVKVAFNPGSSQLEFEQGKMNRILEKVEVLILNQEEAAQLTGLSYEKEQAIFKKIDRLCPGVAIMTKGARGVVVSDGSHLYHGDPLPADIVDKTGAGDSFGSGFVTGLIETQEIGYGIQLGVANATACLEEKGAKNGLLESEQQFRKTKVERESL